MSHSKIKFVPLRATIAVLALSLASPLWAMDDMGGGMGGGMGNAAPMKKDDSMRMQPKNSMPAQQPASSMQDPMATPANPDMMGRMRGVMRETRGMRNMVPNGGMPAETPQSSLPGFPGASHLYHIGSTGFFLDHPQHIALTSSQQVSLNRIKEKAMSERASADRRIEEAEQQLWSLTAADSPSITKIETKVRDIEKARGDQRISFIRAVGEAAKLLSADQQAALLGEPAAGKQPAGALAPNPAAADSAPSAMPGMSAPMPHR